MNIFYDKNHKEYCGDFNIETHNDCSEIKTRNFLLHIKAYKLYDAFCPPLTLSSNTHAQLSSDVCACVRACMRVCVCVCLCVWGRGS